MNNRKIIAEAKVFCSINHPNVVKCQGVLLGDRKAFGLEWCGIEVFDGYEMVPVHSLYGLLQTHEDTLCTDLKLKALHHISAGLKYLHYKGIVVGI